MRPLAGLRVLDFSTLLPGPLATLILAEAGAEVIKLERPDSGEEMRRYRPAFGGSSVNFALLNRGKKSIAIDLKAADTLARLRPLIETAQIVVEQFRPGVMDRLGLGYEVLAAINPRLVYCAITGYGQDGPKAGIAAHDLNYIADSGMLALAVGKARPPSLPPALIADIGGGSLPAVINILLALRVADATGKGCKLDIAMTDNLFAWQYWAMGNGEAAGLWPEPGNDMVTGGSPRYQIYPTGDGGHVAAAPLEQKFWDNFCAAIGLDPALADDTKDPAKTKAAVAAIIASRPSADWREIFAGKDVCCNLIQDIRAALADPHFRARGLFDAGLVAGRDRITALPVPLAPILRANPSDLGYPALGADNALLGARGK